eukprot:TRINITY_DN4160_c0_g2_i3.p1 TRINITY_DN4160_c0_g2~~TRINITY_DN4160_c0_g2_i3.p1  ORF type:complete len:205 (-),score=10.05 TRINITY_DN4160_c0_g2_i3:21-635(-)
MKSSTHKRRPEDACLYCGQAFDSRCILKRHRKQCGASENFFPKIAESQYFHLCRKCKQVLDYNKSSVGHHQSGLCKPKRPKDSTRSVPEADTNKTVTISDDEGNSLYDSFAVSKRKLNQPSSHYKNSEVCSNRHLQKCKNCHDRIRKINHGIEKNCHKKKNYNNSRGNEKDTPDFASNMHDLSLIHICRCRRYAVCRSRWSPYH